MENEKNVSALDVLLRPDLPDVRKILPEKRMEVKRLSSLAGAPVIFTLRGLTYAEVRRVQGKPLADQAVTGVLHGCKEPDFQDSRLLDRERGIVTPLDAIMARLNPGEIDELYVEIEKLSGYILRTLADVKNA